MIYGVPHNLPNLAKGLSKCPRLESLCMPLFIKSNIKVEEIVEFENSFPTLRLKILKLYPILDDVDPAELAPIFISRILFSLQSMPSLEVLHLEALGEETLFYDNVCAIALSRIIRNLPNLKEVRSSFTNIQSFYAPLMDAFDYSTTIIAALDESLSGEASSENMNAVIQETCRLRVRAPLVKILPEFSFSVIDLVPCLL